MKRLKRFLKRLLGGAIDENSIIVLFPYKEHGQWMFDDPRTGLEGEAFIAGIDKMLDLMTANIPDAEFGVKLTLSKHSFPTHEIQLDWIRAEGGGNWYKCDKLGVEGWLCPALYKYFRVAPRNLYAKVEPVFNQN